MSNDAVLALDGKAALVTGGGSGIGLACAALLVRDGCAVTISGRSESRLADALDAIAKFPETKGHTVAWPVISDRGVAELGWA